jgi:pilus assembly protein FimV
MKSLARRTTQLSTAMLAVVLLAAPAAALELGAARVNSTAGTPLDIEIPLLDVEAGELDALRPSLPANSRSAALASASVVLGQGADGTPALRIRSLEPVAGNDLRFVVVADWGRGRRFREYLVSLGADPAAAASMPPAPPAGEPSSATSVQSTSPVPAETTFSTTSGTGAGLVTEPPAAPGPESAPPAAGKRTVRPGETLMSVSREVAAATGATLAQAMVGIYRRNPQAFGKGGMSELLVNSELTLPDAAALGVTSAREASSEISRTLGIWRTGGNARASAPEASGVQTLTTAPVAPAPIPQPVVPSPSPARSPVAVTPPKAAPAPVVAPAPVTAPAGAVAPAPEAAAAPTDAALADKVASLESQLADKSADLQAALLETTALKARLASAEAALVAARTAETGWVGKAKTWAAAAWWSIPALAALSLFLLSLLVLVVRAKGRRAAASVPSASDVPAADGAGRREMTVDLPPIRPKRDTGLPADALLQEPAPVAAAAPAPRRPAPPVVEPVAAEDLEGDPPPVDEAGSKINLARAFIEMGDHDAAILELQAALRLGDERQRAEAIRLLDSLPKT